MGTAWTYQGRLIDANNPADGLYDLQFKLYDDPNAGAQKGNTVKIDDHDVIDGHFAVELDFGSDVFDGGAIWLEVGVRPGTLNDPNVYTLLIPRQKITPVPYALYTSNAERAEEAEDAEHAMDADHATEASWTYEAGFADDAGYAFGAEMAERADYATTADALDGQDGPYYNNWNNLTNVPAGFADGVDNTGPTLGIYDSLGLSSSGGRSPGDAGERGIYNLSSVSVGRGDPANQGVRVTQDGSDGTGYVEAYGPNGKLNSLFTHTTGDKNSGAVAVCDSSGSIRAHMSVSPSGSGFIGTMGPNGNWNTWLTWLTGYDNHGYVAVCDASGNEQAAMYVNEDGQGVVYADIKGFRVTNLSQPDTEIWYTCPEGPEPAVYTRGTSHLSNGRAVIMLPDHFVQVASLKGMTVHLTPLSEQSQGLAVVKKTLEEIEVREIRGAKGNYDFDYMVMTVRKGYEDYRVIRPKSQVQHASFEAQNGSFSASIAAGGEEKTQ
jgi:hypothetical protein